MNDARLDDEERHIAERKRLIDRASRLWRARGCPAPPPKPAFCATCITATPRLLVSLSFEGRPVWLCSTCRP